MTIWNQLPLLKIFIPFVIGIVLALAGVGFTLNPVYFFLPSLLIIFFSLRYKKIIKNYQLRWVFGIVVTLFFFLSGNCLTLNRLDIASDDFSKIMHGNDTLIVSVKEPVSLRENSVRVVAEAEYVKRNNQIEETEGKIMLYFQKDSISEAITYGDRLVVNGSYNLINEPSNPGEFNYKRFLSYRGVHTQGYVGKGNWIVTKQGTGTWLKATALQIRDYFLHIFHVNKIEGEEFGVASALLLGYTDKLDTDLMQAYANTGVLHVLSVSGMHVGVIFIVLNFLLSFLEKRKWGKGLRAIILVLLIWFYAAITGLSPAVNRAAAMITFVIVGKSFGRYTNIYNTLAASALFLLIIDPLAIADMGFQLSYISVIGIVMLQKPIFKLWLPANWFMKQIWLLISVSVAAQLATSPISIFYFHQFPNYFLLTNLLVVPFSNFIIYDAILVLLSSSVVAVSLFLAKILVFLIRSLNGIITYIESLPYSTITGIKITDYEMILLYLLIASLILFFVSNRKVFFKSSLIVIVIFLISVNVRHINTLSQKQFVIYNVRKNSVLGFVQGKQQIIITDSLVIKNKKLQKFFIDNALVELGISKTRKIDRNIKGNEYFENENLFIRNNFVQFGNNRIGLLNKYNYKNIYQKKIKLDCLIISDNINVEVPLLLEYYNPAMVIIDSSNSLYKTRKLLKDFENANIPCHAVSLSGAFFM